MLLGHPGDNTYSNCNEVNLALSRNAVLPLANRIGAAPAHRLAPAFGDRLSLADRHRPPGVLAPSGRHPYFGIMR